MKLLLRTQQADKPTTVAHVTYENEKWSVDDDQLQELFNELAETKSFEEVCKAFSPPYLWLVVETPTVVAKVAWPSMKETPA